MAADFVYEIQVTNAYHTTTVEMNLNDAEMDLLRDLADEINVKSGPMDAPQMFIRRKRVSHT